MKLAQADVRTAVLAFERAARWHALAIGLSDDPFRLDLPALRQGGDISPATMEVLAGLYLVAELEQTGLLRIAELLITERMSLAIRSMDAVDALERAADDARDWYTAEQRDQLYARVFGVGQAAALDTANTQFLDALVGMCSALESWAGAAHLTSPPSARQSVGVHHGVTALRANLADRQHGNTLPAAHRIAGQVRASVEILGHPGVIALVGGTSMWDVVRAVVTDGGSGIDDHLARGQSGQQVIDWAGSPQALTQPPPHATLDAAVVWLASAGFDLRDAS